MYVYLPCADDRGLHGTLAASRELEVKVQSDLHFVHLEGLEAQLVDRGYASWTAIPVPDVAEND